MYIKSHHFWNSKIPNPENYEYQRCPTGETPLLVRCKDPSISQKTVLKFLKEKGEGLRDESDVMVITDSQDAKEFCETVGWIVSDDSCHYGFEAEVSLVVNLLDITIND